jgi:hypothetical protein
MVRGVPGLALALSGLMLSCDDMIPGLEPSCRDDVVVFLDLGGLQSWKGPLAPGEEAQIRVRVSSNDGDVMVKWCGAPSATSSSPAVIAVVGGPEGGEGSWVFQIRAGHEGRATLQAEYRGRTSRPKEVEVVASR